MLKKGAAPGKGAVALDQTRGQARSQARGQTRSQARGQTRAAGGGGTDPRVEELRGAVSRLSRELAGHPAMLPDRGIAEEELRALDAMLSSGPPDVPRLRSSLLLVASAVGSVSALSSALAEMRQVIDLFGSLPGPRAGG